jgi:hypothetical protein
MKLHNLYSSPDIIKITKSRRMGWAGHVARMWETDAKKIFAEKPEEKRSFERPRRRWENNIKINLWK